MIKSLLTKAIAAKILAGTAVAAATGGVALAAADGHFSPHSRLAAPATASSSAQPTDPAASDSSTDASPTVPSVPPTDGTSTSASTETSGSAPHATPSPSLRGLCNAYLARVANSHGKALQNPAFTVLINAAGGSDGVSGYCTTMLATPSIERGKPSSHPAHPSHPAMPTQARNTHTPKPTHSNHSGGNGRQPGAAPTATASW